MERAKEQIVLVKQENSFRLRNAPTYCQKISRRWRKISLPGLDRREKRVKDGGVLSLSSLSVSLFVEVLFRAMTKVFQSEVQFTFDSVARRSVKHRLFIKK